MSEREAYTYTVLRYVHDVMTGEFVNVGVVLHATSGLKSRFRSTHGRISGLFPSLDEKAFKESLRVVRTALEQLEKSEKSAGLLQSQPDAIAFARKAMVEDDSSLQWSPPGSGVTRDAAATLEQIYERFVTYHEKQSLHQRRSEDDVWKPVREKLDELKVADRFASHTFRGVIDEMTAPHAWKNGRWHVISPVSFDLANADGVKEKAHRIRGHFDSVAEGLTEQLELNLVLARPSNPELLDAYKVALKILEKAQLGPNLVEESEAPALVAKLADEIHAHDASLKH